MRGSRKLTAGEMAAVGVEIVTVAHPWLRCVKCGRDWSPDGNDEGELPAGYWKCPAGCNEIKK